MWVFLCKVILVKVIAYIYISKTSPKTLSMVLIIVM